MQIPQQTLLELQISQLRAELAQLRHELAIARVERDLGFKFSDVTVAPDGTVTGKK